MLNSDFDFICVKCNFPEVFNKGSISRLLKCCPQHNLATYIWKKGEPITLKHKPSLRNSFRSFLLLASIFFIVCLVCSTDGSDYTIHYASDFSILNGTYVSGNAPLSVTSVDANYFIVRSEGTDASVNTYNPSGYTLLGSTSQVSGSISNLTSNDGTHMVFSSYFSGLDMEDYVDNDTSNVDSMADKGTHSNFTAQQYGPDSINNTLTEENIGSSDTLWLYVNADDETRTDWTRVGTNPYLDAIDYPTNFVNASGNNLQVGDFNFTDSGKSTETISSVEVQLCSKQTSSNRNLEVFVWDGSSWTSLGTQATPTSWGWMNWTATTVLDTWTKIDDAKMYIMSRSPVGTYEVDCARLKVDYTNPNYELDLEVQWTAVDFNELNEELCIYGGIMGIENIRVDVWNGSDWENVSTDLNSGWNNVSVTSYLDSSTFTIRLKGGNETGDTTQNIWDIDAVFLHVWTDQYTAEVEFAGSSNTYDWKQLNWTFDSAWTTDSVSVTIQLYNYTLGDYPTSGNGFISYTSSATANTDETKNQTITTDQHFHDAAGDWKIKVKAAKTTTIQFNLKADWIMFEPTHWSEYTVSAEFFFSNATTNTPTQLNFTVVSQYNLASINVTIQIWNYSASAYATSGEACFKYTSSGTNETKLLSLNTNPQYYISNGNVKIKITSLSATTTQYQQEVNQVELRVSTQTSSQPSDWFTTLLYVLPIIFGLLFLLALKLKRKKTTASPKPTESPEGSIRKRNPRKSHIAKKTDMFSQQFGTTHQQIKGKKMLLEIDPTTDNHKDVLSFISEAKNNDETLFILTNKNSVLHSVVSRDPNVKLLLLTSETASPLQINEKETLLPANDLSVLLNSFSSIPKEETKKTINVVFDNLSDIILRCGPKKTYKFIPLLLEAISSPKVTALFVFNPTAHGKRVQARIRGMLQKEAA